MTVFLDYDHDEVLSKFLKRLVFGMVIWFGRKESIRTVVLDLENIDIVLFVDYV